MARYRITCATKREKHEYVESLGCYGPDNTFHQFTEAEVIRRIEHGGDTFYTERPDGHVAEVIVFELDGKKYLKTKADGERPNNLDWLPDCPAKHRIIAPPPVVVPSHSHGNEPYWWC
jgi:Protein of unknown function (DUF3892)